MKKQYFITIFLFLCTIISFYFAYQNNSYPSSILAIASLFLFVAVFLLLFLNVGLTNKYFSMIQLKKQAKDIQGEQEKIKAITTALLCTPFTILSILKNTEQITDKHKEMISKQLEYLKPYLGQDKTQKFQNILEKL